MPIGVQLVDLAKAQLVAIEIDPVLQPAGADASEGVIVAAARLGTTRLIDNIEV